MLILLCQYLRTIPYVFDSREHLIIACLECGEHLWKLASQVSRIGVTLYPGPSLLCEHVVQPQLREFLSVSLEQVVPDGVGRGQEQVQVRV